MLMHQKYFYEIEHGCIDLQILETLTISYSKFKIENSEYIL